MVLLRMTLVLLMLFHGGAKIRYGIGSIEQMLQAAGVPGWLGYAVYIGAVFAPLLLVGLWVVPAALIVAINMLTALVLVVFASVFALARERRLGAGIADFFLLICALLMAMTYSKGK